MTLADTNVLLDLATNDRDWAEWSVRRLDAASIHGPLLINAVVYAEFSGCLLRAVSATETVELGIKVAAFLALVAQAHWTNAVLS
jgi:predicted nucleic acid-binding protein